MINKTLKVIIITFNKFNLKTRKANIYKKNRLNSITI